MSFIDDVVSGMENYEAPGMRVPLAHAQKGITYRVVKISGKDETKKHLSDLGFVLNAEVTIVNQVGGNLVCEIKGVRVGLDNALAQRITVIS